MSILKYGEKKKKSHPYYKFFSAVAFLVCKAYPEKFRPFQFPHSNETKDYFKTSRNYIRELRWVIENKLGLEEEFFSTLINMNSFLSNKQLDLYGLGYNTYKHIFKDKKSMLHELIKSCKVLPKARNATTEELREILSNAGTDPKICYIDGCTATDIDVHHIYPKADRHLAKFNFDNAFNLMPLCEDHHDIAHRINTENLPDKNRENWRELVKERIEARETDCL